ncbi:MAG: CheR family methyltransferase [Thermoanaerobaculia bacterium]
MKSALSRMTQQEFQLLDDFITRCFGITFPEHKREILENKLRPRIHTLHLKSFFDYYTHLQYDRNGELHELAQLVTNNETYFFRETGQFDALFEHALDAIKGMRAGESDIRVLSAGCSSGEEPYSLSIYAHENQYRMWGRTVEIDAFDIDAARIDTASRGVYSPLSFRGVEPACIQKYFLSRPDGEHEIKPLYRPNVRFRVGNIVAPETYRANAYEVVFCRNVLIYFDEANLRKAIDNFANALRPGGYLFLGHSESIIGLSDRFHPVLLGGHIAYKVEKP